MAIFMTRSSGPAPEANRQGGFPGGVGFAAHIPGKPRGCSRWDRQCLLRRRGETAPAAGAGRVQPACPSEPVSWQKLDPTGPAGPGLWAVFYGLSGLLAIRRLGLPLVR